MKKILIEFLKIFWKISFAMLFTVGIAVVAIFGIDFEDYGIIGVLFYITLCILISIMVSMVVFLLNNKDQFSANPNYKRKVMVEGLVNELNKFLDKGQYNYVERFGVSISRVLWLSCEYKSRTEIGEMVLKASAYLKHKKTKAKVLIDDIGWTFVPLKQSSKAISNITAGINIAEKIEEWEICAKGYRHLGGIYSLNINSNGYKTKAKESYKLADECINKMQNGDRKNKMIAGMKHAYAEYYYYVEEYDKAIDYSCEAASLYEKLGDDERAVKSYAQRGKIYLEKGEYEEAKLEFVSGLGLAEQVARVGAIVKNHMGLCICYHRDNDIEKAKRHYEECEKNMSEMAYELYAFQSMLTMYNSIKHVFK